MIGFTTPSLLKVHSQTVTLGYSQRQLFDVIAGVQHYPQFVPWCVAANIIESKTALDPLSKQTITRMKAELGVGFQAINERYTSNVTCMHMKSVNAVASNSSLFKTLTTTWTLTPATHLAPLYNASNSKLSLQSHNAQPASYSITSTPTPVSSFPTKRRFTSADLLKTISDEGAKSLLERETPFDPAQFQKSISKEEQAAQKEAAIADHPVCTVDFYIAFEFKSIVYAQVSDLFFNQVSLAMVKSFEERTRSIYGAATPFRQ